MINRTCDIREEKLFLIAYVLWLTDAIVGITMWNNVEIINKSCNYMQYVSYILLAIQFCLKKRYTQKDVLGIFLIVFMCFLGYRSVHNKYILHTMIMVYMSANVDFRKILKCTLVLQGTFMLITVSASHMEIIENVIWDGNGTRIRQSLGYDYCGYPAHLMLFMTLIWFCLLKRKRIVNAVIAVLLNYYIYCATDSRADFYLSILAIIGFCLVNKKCRFKFWMKYGFGIISILSIIVHMLYGFNNSMLNTINLISSNRLKLGYTAIKAYGFSMFGEKIKWIGMGGWTNNPSLTYNYVDCAFLKEILSYGIIFWILLFIGHYFLGDVAIQDKDQKYSWAIIVMWLYGIMNAHLCMPVFNVFILVLGRLFRIEDNMSHTINEENEMFNFDRKFGGNNGK